MSDTARRGGLFDSLRRLLDTATGIAQVRLALLGTEFEQEKLRLSRGLIVALCAVQLLVVAMLLLAALVIALFWDSYRLQSIAALALLFGVAGGWLLRHAVRRLRAPEGGAFALSLAELQRDRQALVPSAPPLPSAPPTPPGR